jgi:nucleotide-binding universal stress UspA family protein
MSNEEVTVFDRILVPLDRSALAECVLPHAVALARALDAGLVLLHVLSGADEPDRLRAVDPLEWQLRQAEAESYLQGVCARLREAGVTCEAQVSAGDAAEFIVGFAHDQNISLIIMASHGQSGLSRWNLSSVAQKVVMSTRASLMVVRSYETAPADTNALQYRRILVPLDGSARAESVLPLATVLARIPETLVLVAHVVQRPALPRRTPPSQEDIGLADRLVERNSAEAESYLETVRLQLPPAAVETHLLVSGQVASALREFVTQQGVDLVLLSAHGYSGETHWPHGGVAASLLAYGSCPLLIFQDAPGAPSVLTQAEAAVRNAESRQE